ncbi:MAG TPA: LPS export ABC transporter periplasmic protein LptC [Patescibacteria group bacterium]|nr:LPS export ABC transporter periplasmic protein LptC [Patescibacteria group bacterium]
MKFFFKKIVPFFIIVAALGCSTDDEKVATIPMSEVAQIPTHLTWNITVRFMDSTITKAILKGRRARVYEERQETLLDSGVVVDFMGTTGTGRVARMTSDSARVDDRTRDMIARGNVVVISDSTGKKLTTTLLTWDNATQKLRTTEYVKIESPGEIIEGFGLESDQYLKEYRIFKVSGIKQ